MTILKNAKNIIKDGDIVKRGITPQVNALASIMLCVAIVILTVGYFLSARNEEDTE